MAKNSDARKDAEGPSEVAVKSDVSAETLKCTICQSTYSDPHILPCLHSFCKPCLSKLIGSTKCKQESTAIRFSFTSDKITMKCPLCRSEHRLSSKGADDLTPNTQLAMEVNKLSEKPPQQQCGECEAVNIASFCSDCGNFLCQLCDQAHKRMATFKNHTLVLPDLVKETPKVKKIKFPCPQHEGESLEVYCTTCSIIICRDCILVAHNGHRFKQAVDVSDEIRRSLLSDSGKLSAKLSTFKSHAEAVAKVEKHVTTHPDKIKAFITAQFEELHKLLEKRKVTLLKEVDTQYNGFSKTLWVEKDIVETSICKLEAGIKFAQQVAKSQDKLEVAVLGNKAVRSMNQTKTLSWDPKAIQNLGPVGFAAQENYREFIKKIGNLKNMELVINDRGYEGCLTSSSHDLKKDGTYCIEVEINFGDKFKALFPQMSISCTCKIGSISVSCTTKQEQQGKWEVTFQTANSGRYAITATLKIDGEDYGENAFKVIEITKEIIKEEPEKPAPPCYDPNLVCPRCGKQFLVGENLKLKRHINERSCTRLTRLLLGERSDTLTRVHHT